LYSRHGEIGLCARVRRQGNILSRTGTMPCVVGRALMAEVGFLEDDHGNKSSMRLLCLMAMVAAVAIAGLMMLKGDPGGNGLYLCGMFLTAAMGGKAGQKWLEQPPASSS